MPQDADWTTREPDDEPPRIDTSTAHAARVYDYLLGGKDNFRPDREAAEQLIKAVPSVPATVRQNRLFLQRLTRYLAGQGIDQFLDIGTGIPTSPNVHEVAQRAVPEARIVYVDNDPIVLAHARALLTSSPQGRVAYLHADLRDTAAVLTAPDLTATLDLTRPAALLMLSTLHLVTDPAQARALLDRYLAALAPGSYLALSVSTADSYTATAGSVLSSHGIPVLQRTRAEVTALFEGLELVDPGVVLVSQWRPDAETAPEAPEADAAVGLYCGVAVKR
ncbi:MAG: SAM-dependent methyltransferase [Trebonia sp.]